MSEKLVIVFELLDLPDGTIGIGNSREVEIEEAILLIEQRQAKSAFCPIGVVPEEWAGE